MLEEFIETLKSNCKPYFGKLSIIRYIYIELGKKVHLDSNFYYANDCAKQQFYSNTKKDKSSLNTYFERSYTNPLAICYIYAFVLDEFGIRNEVIDDYKSYNIFNKIYLSKNIICLSKLYEDLIFIQNDFATKNFTISINNCYIKPDFDKIIEIIDLKIEYILMNKKYTDSVFKNLRYILENNSILNLNQKISIALEKIYAIYNYENFGYCEYRAFTEYFLRVVFKDIPIEISFDDCYIPNPKSEKRKYIHIISFVSKDFVVHNYYYNSNKKGKYFYEQDDPKNVPLGKLCFL